MIGDQRKTLSDIFNNVYLGDLYYSIKISSSSNLSTKNNITISELKGYSCIVIASREEMPKEIEFMKTTLEFNGEFLCAQTLTEAELMVSAGIGFLPVASKVKEKTDDGSITSLPFIKNEEILKSKLYAFYKKSFDKSIYEKLTSIIKNVIK